MSLEERIKRFAEQARGYLLEEFAKSLQQDTTVVKWQGYDQDGKLVVKSKDLTPTVDGVGQKYVTKGSNLILDSTGSVEQRKARRSQPAPVSSKKLRAIPPETLVPRSTIIVFPEFEEESYEEVIGYILIYFSQPFINSHSFGRTRSECNPDQYSNYYGISDYDSDVHSQYSSKSATYGKCFRVSKVYSHIRTDGSVADPGSASATATVGSLSSSTSASNVINNYTRLHNFDYVIEESSQSQTGVCETETMINSFTNKPWGTAAAIAETTYIQFPNAKIYLQWPDDENGDTNVLTVDLNDYVDYPVYRFDLAHNFAKLETDSQGRSVTILYHTYSIEHVDMSDEATSTWTRFVPYQGTTTNFYIDIGKRYTGILHLKTNLSTGSTTSRFTPVQGYANVEYIARMTYDDWGYMFITNVRSNPTSIYHWNWTFDPQAVWQNAFPGDWISAFSGIAWDATAQANVSSYDLRDFASISWDSVNETWEYGLNTRAPSGSTNAYYLDPSETSPQRWLNGQPYYNDYRDIDLLGHEVVFNSTSQQVIPGIDDFVYQEIYNSYYGNPYIPNYQLEIDYTEPSPNDRISSAYISYIPDPEEQEDETNP
jgi:hypothetical protein